MRSLDISNGARSSISAFKLAGYVLLTCMVGISPLPAEELVSMSQRMSRLEAGTFVENDSNARWNRVVLLARPRIASGDVDSLPSMIRNSVSEFVLTIMASVEQQSDQATGESRFRLVDVGVGYSTEVHGELKVVTTDDASKVGVDLSFLTRMMLSENEKQLSKVRIVARNSAFIIIDAPVHMLRNGVHRRYIMRHFVWIDTKTGQNAAVVWLIDHASGTNVVEANEPLRWASARVQEDRAIHVDGKEFNMLGIPNEKAFALEHMPPGKPIAWTEKLKPLAAHENYTEATLRELSQALNETLQAFARSQ